MNHCFPQRAPDGVTVHQWATPGRRCSTTSAAVHEEQCGSQTTVVVGHGERVRAMRQRLMRTMRSSSGWPDDEQRFAAPVCEKAQEPETQVRLKLAVLHVEMAAVRLLVRSAALDEVWCWTQPGPHDPRQLSYASGMVRVARVLHAYDHPRYLPTLHQWMSVPGPGTDGVAMTSLSQPSMVQRSRRTYFNLETVPCT